MNPIIIFEISIATLLLGAVMTALLGQRRDLVGKVSFVFALLAGIGLFCVSAAVFASGTVASEPPLFRVPGIDASLVIYIDELSALFLALIATLGVLSSLYAVRFMTLPFFKALSLGAFYPFLLIFFGAIASLVAMSDLFFFCIFWEVMILASYALVIFNKDLAERFRAGFKYFLINHVATVLMFVGAIIVYAHSRSFVFSDLGAAMTAMAKAHPGQLHLALAFFFVGFSTMAGILPFGDWLPEAYSAAPSPAAATFSGIMSALGIYGILRVFFALGPVGAVCRTWGIVMAVFGTISVFVGSLTALSQNDGKKLLAFSVIGQMSYLLLGVGISLYFLPSVPVLAGVALVATLFHLVNNVFFKSCLFYNAGAIYFRSGTRDLDKIGDLTRLMPLTAFTAVIAGLSMAGIPLLAGFSSRWLLFQSFLEAGVQAPLFMVFAIVALFVSLITLAYAVKFFGSAFFGKYKRGKGKASDGDVPAGMAIPQVVMALGCILFGVLPMLAIRYAGRATTAVLGPDLASALTSAPNTVWSVLQLDFGKGNVAAWSPVVVLVAGAVCLSIAYVFFRAGRTPVRATSTWYSGEEHTDEAVRHEVRGLYLSFKRSFSIMIGGCERRGIYPAIRWPKIPLTKKNFLFRIVSIDDWLFYPITSGFMRFMRYFSSRHLSVPHVHLLWFVIGVFLAVILLFALSSGRV